MAGHEATLRPVSKSETLPITERILARLGRPKWLWVALWSLIPVVSPLVFSSAVGTAERPIEPDAFIDLVATQAAISYACLVFLVGGGVLTKEIAVLRDRTLVSLPMYDRTSCSARPAASAARSSSRRSARRS